MMTAKKKVLNRIIKLIENYNTENLLDRIDVYDIAFAIVDMLWNDKIDGKSFVGFIRGKIKGGNYED